MDFAQTLLSWFPDHKRVLPWRDTAEPYPIWLSEIILQQTRVKQGLPYFLAFLEQFPTVQDLACAPEEAVMRTWQGLGYYSRARNMHATAKHIAEQLEGIFPQTKADLMKLKGVGEYTASAIASFAFGEHVAVADGNVFRVLARYFGIEADISSPKGVKTFQQLAQTLLPETDSSTYNQAIMEFGALQCTPQKPDCMFCPLAEGCVARASGRQGVLPVKTQKIKQKERFFHYLVLAQAGKIALRRRGEGDIWTGLYDFWLEERAARTDFVDLSPACLQNPNLAYTLKRETGFLKHQLTHQTLHINFWVLHFADGQSLDFEQDSFQWYTPDEVHALPKPILIANQLEKLLEGL